MPLIKPNNKSAKKYIRLSLADAVLEEAKNYCQWANVHKLDDFFELTAQFIFKKDTEWKRFKKGKVK